MMSPRFAGCVFNPGMAPGGAATVPSRLIAIPYPAPGGTLKTPGPTGAICTVVGCDFAPLLRVTTTVAVPFCTPCGSTPQGTAALICPDDTKNNGAGMPLNVTDTTSPSELVSGTLLAAARLAARSLPKMDAIAPGAIACPGAKLAPFTIEPSGTVCAPSANEKTNTASSRLNHFIIAPLFSPSQLEFRQAFDPLPRVCRRPNPRRRRLAPQLLPSYRWRAAPEPESNAV